MAMSKWTRSAEGQECQVRLPGCLAPDTSTTVLAHIRRPWNAGVGMKPPDYMGAFACASCHDALDGRHRGVTVAASLRSGAFLDAHLRTLRIWEGMGYL